MKIKEKTVRQYISEDGKTFNTKEDCFEYEIGLAYSAATINGFSV